MINKLQYFTDPHFFREMSAPFSDSNYTYATTGNIIVRFPGIFCGNKPSKKFHKFYSMVQGLKWDVLDLPPIYKIEDLPDPTDECNQDSHDDNEFCYDCLGTFWSKYFVAEINNTWFSIRYLSAVLKYLGHYQIHKFPDPDLKLPLGFRFNGGDGLLMSVRKKEDIKGLLTEIDITKYLISPPFVQYGGADRIKRRHPVNAPGRIESHGHIRER